MKRTLLGSVVWPPLAGIVSLTACVTEGRVEERLEEALAGRLGPAESYEVDVEGLHGRAGEADLVRAKGRRVRPADGPVLDRLWMEARGARYDRELNRLIAAESLRVTAWVRPNDLEAFLESNAAVLSSSITLVEPDRMRVRFRLDLGTPLPGEITADVEGWVEGRGPELHFLVAEARVAGFRVNGGITDRLTRFLNPVVDLSGLPLDVEVTSVQIESGDVAFGRDRRRDDPRDPPKVAREASMGRTFGTKGW